MRATRPGATLVIGTALGLLLAGCGGGSTTASTASTAPKVTQTTQATQSATTPETASVTEAEFAAKLKDEPALNGIPQTEVDCLATLYVKYIRKDELREYVDGTLTLEQFNDPDNPTAKKQMLACIAPEVGNG